jgi:hypothetical protein
MSTATLVDAAREHARQLEGTPAFMLRVPGNLGPVLQALSALAWLASSSSSSSSSSLPPSVELTMLARLIRRAGRRLEEHLDGERPRTAAAIVVRVIEPDVVPIGDGVAQMLGRAFQPAGDVDVAELVEAIATVTEADLGPALQACAGVAGFELPRPWRTAFVPQRHQVVERSAGPKDMIVAVERCGRVAAGGRLVEPALVIVGNGQ